MRLTAAELMKIAITWAEESMVQMISGCEKDDPYRADVADQLKQLRAYRKRRFGAPVDPFKDAKKLTLDELRQLPNSALTRPLCGDK
jgi:hypothetical protein